MAPQSHGTGGTGIEHETIKDLIDSLMERWLNHDRQRQEAIDRRFSQQNEQINQLSRDVATLTADVRTLVENQRGLFSRTQPRPVNWLGIISAAVGAITLWGTATWLLMIPINDTLRRFHTLHEQDSAHEEQEAYVQGVRDANIEWLKEMDRRRWRFEHGYEVE